LFLARSLFFVVPSDQSPGGQPFQGWLARPSPGGRSASSGPMKDSIVKASGVPEWFYCNNFNGL
jgi:hypothetical protein